jgi:hypothetical protein
MQEPYYIYYRLKFAKDGDEFAYSRAVREWKSRKPPRYANAEEYRKGGHG